MNIFDCLLLAQDAPQPFFPGIWLPLILVGVFYYLIVFKPDKQMRAKHAELLKNLKKNDHVVTAGGIHGTVVAANEGASDVTIRIDESTKTKIRVQRSSISRVITEEDDVSSESE